MRNTRAGVLHAADFSFVNVDAVGSDELSLQHPKLAYIRDDRHALFLP